MNSNSYKQYDSRWATMLYPRKPWYIRNCGCGEVAVCNAIIEMATHGKETPRTIQPYMVQFAEARGNGTYHYGIPRAMAHYGMTEVYEHSTMQKLFNELVKGDRVAILLMGKRSAGSKGVHWTGSGHFVSVVQYKKQGNKNWLYVKDSASTSSLRNGWITYEDNIKGACIKCWSGKLAGKRQESNVDNGNNKGKLLVDGIGGVATVNRLQAFLGVKQTGGITIRKDLHRYCPALKAVEYGSAGSATVKYLQKWLGITQDGHWGSGTSKALQKKLGVAQDGITGTKTMYALQKYLNEHTKADYPPAPAKTIVDKELEACKVQADWMKNSKYGYESHPTIEKSKKKGTCVTYVACVLQRIGVLKSGQNLWHNESGKVYGNNDKMTVTYPKGKTLHQLKSQLKAGDIVMDGSGVGSNSHIFILTGKWSGDNPIIWDNHSGQQSKGAYTYTRNRSVIAVVRLK